MSNTKAQRIYNRPHMVCDHCMAVLYPSPTLSPLSPWIILKQTLDTTSFYSQIHSYVFPRAVCPLLHLKISAVILMSSHNYLVFRSPIVSHRYFSKLICLHRGPDKAHTLHLVDMSLVFSFFLIEI